MDRVYPETIDWQILGTPRPVQEEALLRAFCGIKSRDLLNQTPHRRRFSSAPFSGFGYFMEMRTGKTAVLLNEFLALAAYGVNKLLVIAPNKYKDGWYSEAKKFGIVEPIHVFESSRRGAAETFIQNSGKILIINYEALISDANMKILRKFVDRNTFLAADESIKIKNRNTQVFKRALELSKEVEYVRVLTGKPVVQGPHDLWSQLRFIKHLDGFNYFAFRNLFCKMGGFKGKQVIGTQNEEALQNILDKCSFIAKRSNWSDTFETDYDIKRLEMTKQQKIQYDKMEDEFILWLTQDKAIAVDQVITKHMKLTQISSGFIIDEQRQVHELVTPDELPKLVELKDSLENEIEGKVIILCHYVRSLRLLYEQLQEYRPALIAGSELMKKLGLQVESQKQWFNEDYRCRVLIAQLQAVKYGHNLMGNPKDPCLTTIYFENNYSLDDRAQSEQRNQGEGQKAPIHVIDYASSPIEMDIIRALQKKESIAERIVHYYGKERSNNNTLIQELGL